MVSAIFSALHLLALGLGLPSVFGLLAGSNKELSFTWSRPCLGSKWGSSWPCCSWRSSRCPGTMRVGVQLQS